MWGSGGHLFRRPLLNARRPWVPRRVPPQWGAHRPTTAPPAVPAGQGAAAAGFGVPAGTQALRARQLCTTAAFESWWWPWNKSRGTVGDKNKVKGESDDDEPDYDTDLTQDTVIHEWEDEEFDEHVVPIGGLDLNDDHNDMNFPSLDDDNVL